MSAGLEGIAESFRQETAPLELRAVAAEDDNRPKGIAGKDVFARFPAVAVQIRRG